LRGLSWIYKAWQFIKRGFLMMLSYRTALILGIFSGFIGILKFGIMSGFLSSGNNFPLLEQYGGDLLTFLIIGNVFTVFVSLSLNSYQTAIRNEQQMGTLEHLLSGDTPLASIVIYSGLWNFVNSCISSVLLLAVMGLIFDLHLNANFFLAVIVLILSIITLSGIGMASAGIIMVTKKQDPINWIFTALSTFLSGVFFPVEFLPYWLQRISYILPTTYALRALRLTLIRNYGIFEIKTELFALIISCLITVPLGIFFFNWGFKRARVEGSLTQY
jgi:ABC-2 type transport system permease protein